ncbi:hypothetical protein TELCIR_20706 [Teladorsagia circumcincta]|uniref:RNA-directed DNA polymerase n=1 Tax=Teladorsagia circumcincta TaxID=45464 RepID=A0A2G9TIQ8_TELCI|nr:hypothetical protein TELCIR_20706 [Teladorsagia circumcincta]
MRRDRGYPISISMDFEAQGKRVREVAEKRWKTVIKEDLSEVIATAEDAPDRLRPRLQGPRRHRRDRRRPNQGPVANDGYSTEAPRRLSPEDGHASVAPLETVFDWVSRRIKKFSYDADQDNCFNLWYKRHKDFFEVNCQGLDEAIKASQLITALDAAAHTRFTRHILLKEPGELNWTDTLATLKALSGTKESIFRRRFECFRIRISAYGFRIDKCQFLITQLTYLGKVITAAGRRPDPKKIDAIIQMPKPKDTAQIRSFLGLINYYGAFVPEMCQLRAPIDALLKKKAPFNWNSECDAAFERAKGALALNLLLTHYNPNLPIVIAADAPDNEIGAVISHRYQDGKENAVITPPAHSAPRRITAK